MRGAGERKTNRLQEVWSIHWNKSDSVNAFFFMVVWSDWILGRIHLVLVWVMLRMLHRVDALPYPKVVNTGRKELGGTIVIFTLNVVFLSMGHEGGYISVWLSRRIWQWVLCVCSLYYLIPYDLYHSHLFTCLSSLLEYNLLRVQTTVFFKLIFPGSSRCLLNFIRIPSNFFLGNYFFKVTLLFNIII